MESQSISIGPHFSSAIGGGMHHVVYHFQALDQNLGRYANCVVYNTVCSTNIGDIYFVLDSFNKFTVYRVSF
jgi:hypothetical protein